MSILKIQANENICDLMIQMTLNMKTSRDYAYLCTCIYNATVFFSIEGWGTLELFILGVSTV